LVGRFQPFHAGHLAVVRSIRTARPADELIIGVGSAEDSHTALNPFTAGERIEMIDRGLRAAHVTGWTVVPLADIHRHALWVAHLESLLPPFGRIYTNNPLTRMLFEAAKYDVESPTLEDRDRLEGAQIRALMARGGEWEDRVPAVVASYLKEIQGPARLRLLMPPDPA
jgi:nicotinamide-nucleotide adenylyltransferase